MPDESLSAEQHRFVGQTLKEQNKVLRRAPARSGAVNENVRWTFESEQKWGWRPLIRGCRHSDWGLRQLDFEEIRNDGPTNPLALSNIDSSDRR